MTVRITQIAGKKLKAESDGLEVISGRVDENTPAGGMNPGKLMAAALGFCTGMHVVSYLKHLNIDHKGFEITVDTINASNPGRCEEFTTNIKLNAELSEKQRKGLLEDVNRCYVGNTLKGTPEININLSLP
jgi:uncharacterized OsmC-like protein